MGEEHRAAPPLDGQASEGGEAGAETRRVQTAQSFLSAARGTLAGAEAAEAAEAAAADAAMVRARDDAQRAERAKWKAIETLALARALSLQPARGAGGGGQWSG
jgi:hypothetical protein